MTKPEYDRLDTLYEQLDSPIGLERRMLVKREIQLLQSFVNTHASSLLHGE